MVRINKMNEDQEELEFHLKFMKCSSSAYTLTNINIGLDLISFNSFLIKYSVASFIFYIISFFYWFLKVKLKDGLRFSKELLVFMYHYEAKSIHSPRTLTWYLL
uniref:Uncharacterized protein n=1 Tax=Cacopsylla melanoneura TaxID=428564 RepID=A0A8D8RG02_9HEMI